MDRGALPLAGVSVIFLRNPERAAGMADEVRRIGAEPFAMPLIDFEQMPATAELEQALARLAGGGYQWVVFTSITAVASLRLHARSCGRNLVSLLTGGPRIAAVGSSTAKYLAEIGVTVNLVPEGSQSTRGLLEKLPAGPGAMFLPQADIADGALAGGLAAAGWDVDRVTVYRTVDHPADAERRLDVPLPTNSGTLPLSIDFRRFRSLAAGQGPVVVVLPSPSSALRFRAMLGKEAPTGCADGPLTVAIGPSTEAAAEGAGLLVDAVAARPTPEGVADAVVRILSGRRPAPKNGVIP